MQRSLHHKEKKDVLDYIWHIGAEKQNESKDHNAVHQQRLESGVQHANHYAIPESETKGYELHSDHFV